MRLKTFFAMLAALLLTGLAAAQTPAVTAPPPLDPENIWVLDLSSGGRVTIQLRPDVAPNHVERIKTLTRQGFYNGLTFHRVIPGFMAQGGDPKGDGTGGSELPDLVAEFNALPHLRGTLSMARASDENSANSQFFIMLHPRMTLDKKYTAFGRVVSGMQYVDAIQKGDGVNGEVANPTRILQASIAADNLPPPPPQAETLNAPAPEAAPPALTIPGQSN